MKHLYKSFFLFLFLSLSFQGFAQLDNSNGGKDKKGTSLGIIEAPAKKVTKPKSLNLGSTDGFKTAHQQQQKKLRKKQKEASLKNKGIISKAKISEERFSKSFRKINGRYAVVDQNLGSFRSDSKFIKIYCRDYQHPDNDRVTVYHNGIPVVYNIVLEQRFQSFQIPLEVGLNTIDFKALNQGTSGSNTAGFKIYDDSGTLISANQWELATGAKATIAIAKSK